jgi:phospholipid/cholesterol/gamma-HCH transport system permease protein
LNPLQPIGRAVLALLAEIGRVALFLKDGLSQGLSPTYFIRQILEQMWRIGYNSLPVVGLTAFFTGGALALQIYLGSSRFNAEGLVASIVALGITRELGPVLAGLMVAGRVGASIAAELGTMRVTEQIDALVTLSTNPFKYLVGPRIVAAVVTLPILVAIGDTIGIMGGYIVGTRSLGFNSYAYIKNTQDFLEVDDVTSGLIKAAAFGFIIAVGRATTNAVVSSAILILAANFALTNLLFSE